MMQVAELISAKLHDNDGSQRRWHHECVLKWHQLYQCYHSNGTSVDMQLTGRDPANLLLKWQWCKPWQKHLQSASVCIKWYKFHTFGAKWKQR